MTKDELIQKLNEWKESMLEVETSAPRHGNYLAAYEASIKIITINNLLELVDELERAK
jgi:hypothetical protein